MMVACAMVAYATSLYMVLDNIQYWLLHSTGYTAVRCTGFMPLRHGAVLAVLFWQCYYGSKLITKLRNKKNR